MNYCNKCRVLFEDDHCPHCDNPYVWPPEGDDYCLLAEKEFPWWEVLEQALKDAGIPVAVNSAVVGAWMTVQLGRRFELGRLFVPYSQLEQARQIEAEMFDGKGVLAEDGWVNSEGETN